MLKYMAIHVNLTCLLKVSLIDDLRIHPIILSRNILFQFPIGLDRDTVTGIAL